MNECLVAELLGVGGVGRGKEGRWAARFLQESFPEGKHRELRLPLPPPAFPLRRGRHSRQGVRSRLSQTDQPSAYPGPRSQQDPSPPRPQPGRLAETDISTPSYHPNGGAARGRLSSRRPRACADTKGLVPQDPEPRSPSSAAAEAS